ncbi:asparagine synthase (glutamine-hydrolyzing) [Desulfobacula sp.]|uniref:asparagine synthase (glutamine-hydrolyzing) n=1 Tax=Desulfobacula sp. TaxID=2593537 RepID=UPI00261F06C6|nr:asparagine synthase (glutamine-hydrolyzing) [Desulfobacula sp.]
MCGIAGFVSSKMMRDGFRRVLEKMADAVAHRGPDNRDVWFDPEAGVGLAHRRLSIIDLSPEGHQPMTSHSGRFVITYNGEIYNFKAVKKDLSDQEVQWRGDSDTEVLLAAVENWGVRNALEKVTGMFSFALWDRKERLLFLARDRLGEKPLYYGWQGKTFLFGSELKTLKRHPDWEGTINRNSLALYLRYNYIPAPYSIYHHIYKLTPGSYVKISVDCRPGECPVPQIYWDAEKMVANSRAQLFSGSESEAIDSLDRLLRKSIRNKMISDVSLGAFLSGGIDSSTIVAMMQAESTKPVKTFSIGFNEAGYDEAPHAKRVAAHLGTDHTELYVSSRQAMDVIPKLPLIYDEPFSDSSQIPTFLVSEMARQYVTVALSGDGGDELFGGYNRYSQGRVLEKIMTRLPVSMRRFIASLLCLPSPMQWDRFFSILPFSPKEAEQRPGDKLHKLAEVLAVTSTEQIYHTLVSHWKKPSDIVLTAIEPKTVLTDRGLNIDLLDLTEQMMYFDLISYLPDDILCKVDRAAMAVSLETRVPFLDHEIVAFAWRLPLSMKLQNGKGKWILQQVLHRYVPERLMDRPKMGFAVPIDSWLRGPLRGWADGLLDKSRLKDDGFFEPGQIHQKWADHLSGKRNWQYDLWDVLMFQAWLENQE